MRSISGEVPKMSKKKVFAVGIDVSAKELHVAVEGLDEVLVFPNTAEGHVKLAKRITKGGRHARVVLEATGMYHLDVALQLANTSRCEVMVANPRATHAFHRALGTRAKTDKVDAGSLLQFARSMPFVLWTAPDKVVLEFRAYARYLDQLIKEKVRLQTQLEAAASSSASPAWVIEQLQRRLDDSERNITGVRDRMAEHCDEHHAIRDAVARLVTIPGIGTTTAMRLVADFLLLDPDMTSKEITAWAGLDPRPRESGTSVRGRRSISKHGSSRARAALYMAAVAAARCKGPLRGFYQRISGPEGAKKPGKVGIVAVMRKLLVVAWALHRTQTEWSVSKASPRRMACAA